MVLGIERWKGDRRGDSAERLRTHSREVLEYLVPLGLAARVSARSCMFRRSSGSKSCAARIQPDDRGRATRLLGHQRPAVLLIPAPGDVEDEIRRGARQFAGEKTSALDTANLGHRALRAPVFLAHPENHGIYECKGMIEHQPFDFAIGLAAPMAPGDEGPADLDFA
jgi:hypothetical protein